MNYLSLLILLADFLNKAISLLLKWLFLLNLGDQSSILTDLIFNGDTFYPYLIDQIYNEDN